MLILSRRAGQSILIGDNIKVTLLRVNPKYPGNYELAIEAPDSVRILRSELLDDGEEEEADLYDDPKPNKPTIKFRRSIKDRET